MHLVEAIERKHGRQWSLTSTLDNTALLCYITKQKLRSYRNAERHTAEQPSGVRREPLLLRHGRPAHFAGSVAYKQLSISPA